MKSNLLLPAFNTVANSVARTGHVGTVVAAVAMTTLSLGSWPVNALAEEPLSDFITEASRRFDLPELWLRSVIEAESDGNARAVSPKGAMGLMQLMPGTFAELRTRYGLGVNPFDPHDNILAGAAYLREMLDRFGTPGFLAAYNAGPARMADHLATGRTLPEETNKYMARLAPMLAGMQADRAALAKPLPPTGGFQPSPTVSMIPFQPHSAGLFVASLASGGIR